MKSKIGVFLAGLYFLMAIPITIYGYSCGGGWCNYSIDVPVVPEILLLAKQPQSLEQILLIHFRILYLIFWQ